MSPAVTTDFVGNIAVAPMRRTCVACMCVCETECVYMYFCVCACVIVYVCCALISEKPQCRLAPVTVVNAAFELLIEP